MEPRDGAPGLVAVAVLRRGGSGLRSWVRLFGRALWRGVVEFYNSDDLTHAASVSYYALLSLFPFFLLVFSLLGQFAVDESRRQAIVDFLLRYFPAHLDFLTAQLDALRTMRVRLGLGGLLALIWASNGVFGALSSAVNHAWSVEKPRSFLSHRLFSFLMMLAAGLVLVLALALISVAQILQAAWAVELATRTPSIPAVEAVLIPWATTLMLVVVVGFILYFVPNTKVRFLDVWPGAVVTGVLWRVMMTGFAYYMADMSRLNAIHGSIAAVIVFLVWVYACVIVLMYGVEFTAAYARLRRAQLDEAQP